MGKHELPPLRMIVEKGRLVPASPFDQERLDGYQNGARLQVSLWQGRNSKLSRKYWAILHKVIADLPCPWQTAEEASDALKLACGITDAGKTVNDQWFIRPGSISFSSMPEDKFRDFFERAMAVLARVTGVDPTTLGQEAADVGDEDENSDDAPLSQSSDEAGESPSPADTDGDGSTPSQESSPSEEEREPGEDDDQDDITDKERDILIRYARSMLDAGADPKKDRAQIEKMHGVWKAGDFKNFGQAALGKAKSIFDSAQAIARGDASFEAAVSFFEEVLEAEGQIGGQNNG